MGLFDLQCPVCGGPLRVRGLRGLCENCDSRETLQNIQKKPHQPKPKPPVIRSQKPENLRDKPEANREVARLQDNSRLSLNSQQEYRQKTDGDTVIKSFTSFGQEYVTLQSREGMGLDPIQDGTTFDRKTNPSGPPENPYNPPTIPPFIEPIIPPPIPTPPIRPPRHYPPIGPNETEPGEEPEEPVDCTGATAPSITVTNSTVAPSGTTDIEVTGGTGDYTVTVSDPLGLIDTVVGNTITMKPSITNTECAGNPVITVTDECGLSDNVTVYVTTGYETSGAYRIPNGSTNSTGGPPTVNCQVKYDVILCNGTNWGESLTSCEPGACATSCPGNPCPDERAAACTCAVGLCGTVDDRSAAMITAGCCPEPAIP